MFKLVRRITMAPLTYLADLRKLKAREYLLVGTNFSPAYPVMIFTALLTTLALAAFIIIDTFTLEQGNSCFANVRYGAYIISILYPIETVLCFICITGSIALSKNSCWRVVWIILFGPLLCGFGFGEFAFIQMCLLSTRNEGTFNTVGIFKREAFIDSMVYLYISFLLLYFILIPIFDYLYKRQKQDEDDEGQEKDERKSRRRSTAGSKKSVKKKQEPPRQQIEDEFEKQSTCCNRCICILYYIVVTLFIIAFLFIAFIKLIGPALFTFIWVEMATSTANYDQTKERVFFALSLVAYFAPLGIAVILFAVQRIFGIGGKQSAQLYQGQSSAKETKTIQLAETNPKKKRNSRILEQTIMRSRQNTQKARQTKQIQPQETIVSKSKDRRSMRDALL